MNYKKLASAAALPSDEEDGVILGALSTERSVDVRVGRSSDPSDARTSVKLYFSGAPVGLSDSLPVMERFGLKVADYRSIPYGSGKNARAWVHEFLLDAACPAEWATQSRYPLEDAMRAVWRGDSESDDFCGITTVVGLSWREVAVLRAYSRYLRQIGFPLAGDEIAAALRRNQAATLALVGLFDAMFDPDASGNRGASVSAQSKKARQALDVVEGAEDDRILRKLLTLIEATLRTNYYQRTMEGEPKSYLSFKLNSCAIEGLPEPCPQVEIFVYSPRAEGIHLRGGKVARGGIRWSDRQADFRTEIHGLLKAQMVKNVVIVPQGSKGGFIVKRPLTDAQAQRTEAIACYEILIRGMLDLTDNIKGDAVVSPARVVCVDDPDPYLVVAADKGTATFSDAANRISAEYGYWLGDAFASGGSTGYDHKAIAITARGAWESVRRHFRELGRDIQNETFTVIGVGDMSGDVFGNGMLLSPGIRLLGAFDHRHIFLDPNADAQTGIKERQRLAALPRSSWADYAVDVLGAGGGIFDRSARSITISVVARDMLGLPSTKTTPNAVINALLKAEADLLWLGGIGTYVKASGETHDQVDDHACDAIRVDADTLRCKVVGEGANLGFTQKARVQYALAGGRINTDAIDNAGGVNCSDHEVNIKILCDLAMKAGKLTLKKRNALLASMSDEVAALVLRDNYLQSQALSVAEANAAGRVDTHQRLMQSLERGGQLDRALACLPDDEELKTRRAQGRGLARPELAMLLAYTKIAIYNEVIKSGLPDESLFSKDLAQYFPSPLRQAFSAEINRHPLRREIVATMVVNGMVNRVGSGFVNDLQEKTACTDDEAMRAYAVVRDVFNLEQYWRAVEELDGKTSAPVQVDLLLAARALVEVATLWVLRNVPGLIDVSATVERFGARIARLLELLPNLPLVSHNESYQARLSSASTSGVPAHLARTFAALPDLENALDIALLAERIDIPVEDAANVYYPAYAALDLPLLKTSAAAIPCRNAMESMAVTGLVDQLGDAFARLARRLLTVKNPDSGPVLERFLGAKNFQKDRLRTLTADLRRGEPPSLALLSVASQSLSALAGI